VMPPELHRALLSLADEKFGTERTQQLRLDIEQTADDLEKIRAIPLQVEDEA
jgi:hypothetical protein